MSQSVSHYHPLPLCPLATSALSLDEIAASDQISKLAAFYFLLFFSKFLPYSQEEI
jgi:hypothetical protein